MRKSEEAALLYGLAVYVGVSMLSTVILLMAALAVMKGFFAFARFAFGAHEVYRIKPLLCDSVGFAFASAGTAVTQYYFVSLLRRAGLDRAELAVTAFFTAVLCGLFFWRGALHSSLGGYGFPGLTVTLAAILGAQQAVFQKQGENPWPASVSAYFK